MLPCTGPYFAAEVTLGCERNELTRYELCIYSRVPRHNMSPRFKTIEQNQCIFHPCSDLRDQGNTQKRRVAIIARCKYATPCYAFLVVHSDPPPRTQAKGGQKSDGIAAREETAAKYTRQYRTRARARQAAYPSVESRPVILCAKTPKRKKKSIKMYANVMNGGCSRPPTRARSTCRQKSSGRLRRCRIRVDG
jgi:hypothetical protein